MMSCYFISWLAINSRDGRVPGGTIVLSRDERNDQERSHRSRKNERLECVLKNIGMIGKRTERNGMGMA